MIWRAKDPDICVTVLKQTDLFSVRSDEGLETSAHKSVLRCFNKIMNFVKPLNLANNGAPISAG